jgi:hypothetical protein
MLDVEVNEVSTVRVAKRIFAAWPYLFIVVSLIGLAYIAVTAVYASQ